MFNSLLYAYIQHDSRNVKRTRASYHVTAEFFNKRYSAMLPADLVQNKTILDLGCGLGAAGAWALLNGANRYVGIDIQDSCVRKAALLASECGLAGRAEFHCVALEDVDFSKFPQADILIAAGVLFTNPDVFGTLLHISNSAAQVIIIDSRHPVGVVSLLRDVIGDSLPTIIAHKLSKIVAFVKSQNLIELTPESSVSSGAEPGKLTGFCQGLPSLAGLVTIMSSLGYQPDFTSHYAAEKSMLEYSLADCLQDPNRQESCRFMISFSLNGVKQELSLASLYNSESDRLVFSRYI